MTSTPDGMPNVLLHHLKHNQVLHEQVVLFSISDRARAARSADSQPRRSRDLGHGFYRVIAQVGFMQSPDVPDAPASCGQPRRSIAEPMTTTYYLGRETLLTSGKRGWRAGASCCSRSCRGTRARRRAFFNLPPNRVVELGLQIEM